jgi:hypothetical protein
MIARPATGVREFVSLNADEFGGPSLNGAGNVPRGESEDIEPMAEMSAGRSLRR